MKEKTKISYNPILMSLLTINQSSISVKWINGNQYLVNSKKIKKAHIELRAKIPLAYLTEYNEIKDFYDLEDSKKEEIKKMLIDRLVFSSQEIIMLFLIIDLYLSNIFNINFVQIHKKRQLDKIDMNKEIDLFTLSIYKRTIEKLTDKIVHIEIEKCNPTLYGVSNKQFSTQLLKLDNNVFRNNELLKILSLSEKNTDLFFPEKLLKSRFNQITKFLLAYEFAYQIYSYKNNPVITSYEINVYTLMKKIPYFYKNGKNANMNIYQYIKKSKSKTQIIDRFFKNCLYILTQFKNENIISSYEVYPDITTANVKNFEKIKFCLKLRG